LVGVVATCLRGAFAIVVVPVAGDPESSPARMRATASVTATRNAAGAAYRRQSPVRTYQPDAAQTSRRSRDASAPAASRKSVPLSRWA
jgi:hypothetical protein